MTDEAAELAAPRLLSRLLQPGSAWPLDQCLQMVRRLAAEIQSLHRSGRIHRALGAEAVIVEEGRPPRLPPCPAQRFFGGDDCDPEFCPAELADGDSLELPASIEAAAAILRARSVSLDPRQIDIYQLGTLFCRLLSGQSMASYMYTARGKVSIPAPARPLLERMLGHDAALRFHDMAEVLAAINSLRAQLGAAQDVPAMRDAPLATAIGTLGDTPRHGFSPASLNEIATAQPDPLPFEKLGHYRILARIGRGGMGDVYQGYDDSLRREVAVKVLPAELARNEDFVRRFRAEAEAAGQIAHPNVVPIFFIGEDAGHHFFVMQYVRGESLASRLALRRRLPLDEVQRLLEQCLAGLGAAHAQGLIHRDIKPGNILLENESGRAMLVDFGLVRRMDDGTHVTATGIVMGTVDYIAPEQARGQAVDGRTDLYSLGVLAYQLISGRLPFVADTPMAVIFQHTYEQPLPLDEAAPDVPQSMVRIVARLMAKTPADRYQNTAEVLADLEAAREGRELSPLTEAGEKPDAALSPVLQDTDIDWEQLLPQTPSNGVWQRIRDFAAALFRRRAPESTQQLQSTTQQVESAAARYQRRRDRLARLVEERERVFERLPAGPEREEQRQPLEDLKSQLAKADATLAQLHNQRDLLQARLHAVGASNDPGLEKVASRRRQFVLAGSFLALVAAGWIAWALLARIPRPGSSVMLPQGPVVSAVDQPNTGNLPTIGEIDLLKSVNVDRDRESGKWAFGSNGLTAHAHPWDGLKRLVIPVDVTGDYDLFFDFTRNEGSGSLGVHYPVNGVPAHVALSRFNGEYGGIVPLIPPDQPITADIASAIKKPNHLVNGRRYRATISVRTKGDQSQVRVSLDDGSQLTYSGPTERLRTVVPGVRSLIASRPTLDAEGADVTFHRVILHPISAITASPISSRASVVAIREGEAKNYHQLDTNGDGVLDFREWWQREYKHLPEQTMRRMFKVADRNGDGKIDMQEYVVGRRLDFHFCRIDTDCDDRISRQELAVGDKVRDHHQDMDRIFNAYDVNGDGWLSSAEFTDRSPGGQYPETRFFLDDLNADGRLSVQEFTFRTNPEDLASWKGTFEKKDTNHDGYLTLREYVYDDMDRRFWDQDLDADGYVSEAEYRRATAQAAAPDQQGHKRGIASVLASAFGTQRGKKWGVTPFSSMDLNHDGKLSIAEYHTAFNLSQKSLAQFTAHKRDAWFVRWTPDGHTLITGGMDNFVRRWDMTSGKCVEEIPVPGAVTSGAVSHNGQILAVGQYANSAIQLWDIQRQKPLGALLGHTERTYVLAFSPNDRVLVSGGYDCTIQLWDLESKKLLRALRKQLLPVTGLAISPDGKTLAATMGDWRVRNCRGELKLWDMASGRDLTPTAPSGSRFDAVAFSPDGSTLAYGGTDWAVYLSNVSNLHERRLLRPSRCPCALQFLAQGRFLAVGEGDNGVAVWDVNVPDDPRIRFQGHKTRVHSVDVSPDGSALATGSADGTVGLWPLPREAWSQSTSAGAMPTSADLVRRWSALGAGATFQRAPAHQNSGDVPATPRNENAAPAPGGWDKRKESEASRFHDYDANGDGFLDFQEFWKGEAKGRSEQHAQRMFKAADQNEDGKIDTHEFVEGRDINYHFYRIDIDGDIRLSRPEFADGEKLAGHRQNMDRLFDALDLNGDGWLAMAEYRDRPPAWKYPERDFYYNDLNGDGRLSLEEFTSKTNQADLAEWKAKFAQKDTNHDGSLSLREYLYDSADKPFWDRDLNEDGCVSEAEYLQALDLVAPSPDQAKRSTARETFASMDLNHDGKLSFREYREFVAPLLPGLNPLQTGVDPLQKGLAHFTAHKADALLVRWTPDGRTLITGGMDRVVRLWDMTSGKCIGEIPAVACGISSGAVSHNGQILAAGQYGNTAFPIRLWDIQRRQPLGELLGHTQDCCALAFSPDDKILVSGDRDKTIRFWDLESKKLLRTLPTQALPITALAISPDGKTLAVTAADRRNRSSKGELRLWDMATGNPLTPNSVTGPLLFAAAFSPDSSTLAYGGNVDWAVYLCDVAKPHQPRPLRGSTGPTALQFLAQGRLLAAGEATGRVSVWDVTMPTEPRIRFQGHKTIRVHSIAVSPDGSLLATAAADGTVGLWPLPREAWSQSASAGASPTSADLVRKWPAQNQSADKAKVP